MTRDECLKLALMYLNRARTVLLAAEADGLLAGDDRSAVGYARADIGTALAELKPLLQGVAATPSPTERS